MPLSSCVSEPRDPICVSHTPGTLVGTAGVLASELFTKGCTSQTANTPDPAPHLDILLFNQIPIHLLRECRGPKPFRHHLKNLPVVVPQHLSAQRICADSFRYQVPSMAFPIVMVVIAISMVVVVIVTMVANEFDFITMVTAVVVVMTVISVKVFVLAK